MRGAAGARSPISKQFADTVNYLTEQKLYTVDDLEARVNAHNAQTAELAGQR